jgi:hypothetical protein
MSEGIRINRIVEPVVDASGPGSTHHRPVRPLLPWVILGVLVLAIISLGVFFRDRLFPRPINGPAQERPAGQYQAVFLVNGQVYFGRLEDRSGEYVVLRDIYYLRVTQPPLQGPAEQTQQQPAQTQQQPQISLVKLGSELHGPEDEMYISRAQVLFYENLTENGQVVQAIKKYEAGPHSQPSK